MFLEVPHEVRTVIDFTALGIKRHHGQNCQKVVLAPGPHRHFGEVLTTRLVGGRPMVAS